MKLGSVACSLSAIGLLTLPLGSRGGGHFGCRLHSDFSSKSSSSAVVHGFRVDGPLEMPMQAKAREIGPSHNVEM